MSSMIALMVTDVGKGVLKDANYEELEDAGGNGLPIEMLILLVTKQVKLSWNWLGIAADNKIREVKLLDRRCNESSGVDVSCFFSHQTNIVDIDGVVF